MSRREATVEPSLEWFGRQHEQAALYFPYMRELKDVGLLECIDPMTILHRDIGGFRAGFMQTLDTRTAENRGPPGNSFVSTWTSSAPTCSKRL
jgi:hypothetical protein